MEVSKKRFRKVAENLLTTTYESVIEEDYRFIGLLVDFLNDLEDGCFKESDKFYDGLGENADSLEKLGYIKRNNGIVVKYFWKGRYMFHIDKSDNTCVFYDCDYLTLKDLKAICDVMNEKK